MLPQACGAKSGETRSDLELFLGENMVCAPSQGIAELMQAGSSKSARKFRCASAGPAVQPLRRRGFRGTGEYRFNVYFDHKKLRALAEHHGYNHLPICMLCTVWRVSGAAGGAATRPLLVGLLPVRSGSLRLPPSGCLLGA